MGNYRYQQYALPLLFIAIIVVVATTLYVRARIYNANRTITPDRMEVDFSRDSGLGDTWNREGRN
jgi:hypothetical protein